MDQKYFDEIKAREQAATQGPWNEEGWALPDEDGEYVELTDGSPADAVFIAHARTDIPALIAEIKHLQEIHANWMHEEMDVQGQFRAENVMLKKAMELMVEETKSCVLKMSAAGMIRITKFGSNEQCIQYFLEKAKQVQEQEKQNGKAD